MYRIAICDDEKIFLTIISEQVEKYCKAQGIRAIVKRYSDAVSLIEDIEAEKLFDVYILDIELGNYSGLQIAKLIESYSNISYVIFVTSYNDYAIEACGMSIFRYVLKEKLEQKFPEVLRELFQCLKRLENNGVYVISSQRKFVKFSQRDIIYIYKHQKSVVFVLRGGREEYERSTLTEVYKKLDPKELIFLDRGIIINLFHVQKVSGKQIIMNEGHNITTNLGDAGELKRFLNRYWGELI